jgi:hypothetical protein
MAKKGKKKEITRNINMAEHELRVRSIGMSERLKKNIIRTLIILIPVILFIYWIAKTR